MGKMKDHLIGLEEDYFAMGEEIVNECEVFDEFVHRMDKYREWVVHYDNIEIKEILSDIWMDYWGKYV